MSASDVVLSPSDLASARKDERLRVGGRVLSAAGQRLTLADAFASIEVELRAPVAVTAGDLIVVSGTMSERKLAGAEIIEQQRCPTPRGDGELARLVFDGIGPRLAARATAFATIRDYFAEQGFVEVDTPQRVAMPGLDLHVDAIAAAGGYLVTSPEHQMKRLLAGGMPRIYQLAHASRAGELGPWHEPEFCILEWYRAFASQVAVMTDTEQIVSRVARALGAPTLAPALPFARMTVTDAFLRFADGADALMLAEHDEDRFFELLVSAVEPALGGLGYPIFLHDYPIQQASLAREKPDDPRVAERFELYVSGIELCNGFGELTDAGEQRRRFERDQQKRRALGRPVYPVDERLLAALEEGMPPSGGNALGVDRLIALSLGASEIAAVMPFPASRL